tara:strand:- start:331 stop:576 length:246 start_codon:yes stop_codon:yes gene_type:complete
MKTWPDPFGLPYKRIRYEAPADLRKKTIHIRYNKVPAGHKSSAPIRIPVYYKGNRIGQAKALDRIANDRPPVKQQPQKPAI